MENEDPETLAMWTFLIIMFMKVISQASYSLNSFQMLRRNFGNVDIFAMFKKLISQAS